MDDFATGFIAGQSDNNNGNNNGWGADGGWLWILVIFALLGFGGNGWGNWGGNNGGGALTRSDICSEFNFNNLEGAVRGISQGICDSTFALNNTIVNGFNGVGNAVCNLGYEQAQLHNATQMAMMQGFNAAQAQAADCCCKTQTGLLQLGNQVERGFCQTNFNDQANTTSIIQNAHNDTDRVLAKLDAMEMSRKDERIAEQAAQIQALQLAASQANQNNAIGAMISASEATILRRTGAECPTAAYIVQPPTPVSFPTNCCGQFNGWGNNGCGCNSGCGC